MFLTVNETGYFWINKGETCEIRFMTVGTTEIYEGKTRRILGTKRFIHISDKPIFMEQKKANCQGQGCPYCQSGHTATLQFDNIEILLGDKKHIWSGFQKSISNLVGGHMDSMIATGKDPTKYVFRITHTEDPYPNNWIVMVLGLEGDGTTQPRYEAPEAPSGVGVNLFGESPTKETNDTITDDERKWMEQIQENISAKPNRSVKPDDWIETLITHFGVEPVRAGKLVEVYVTDEGEFVFVPGA